MFKKKKKISPGHVNVRLKRNNLFTAKVGNELMKTPSSGTHDKDFSKLESAS